MRCERPPVLTIRVTRCPRWTSVEVDRERTTDPGERDAGARPAGFAAPWLSNFGVPSAGKRATGIERSGIDTRAAGGLTIARTDAAISVAYGRTSAARPITANQNRWRRVPRPRIPRAPNPPSVCGPPYAGASWLRTHAPSGPPRSRPCPNGQLVMFTGSHNAVPPAALIAPTFRPLVPHGHAKRNPTDPGDHSAPLRFWGLIALRTVTPHQADVKPISRS